VTIGLDARAEECDYVCEWGREPLPLLDASFDRVFASHVLEHIAWYRTYDALREAWRVLKPAGELELYTPDFAHIVQGYQSRQCLDTWRRFNSQGHFMRWVNGRIFAYGPDAQELDATIPIPLPFHKAVFDYEYLAECLTDVGFVEVRRLPPRPSRPHGEELGAIAIKGDA